MMSVDKFYDIMAYTGISWRKMANDGTEGRDHLRQVRRSEGDGGHGDGALTVRILGRIRATVTVAASTR